MEFKLQNLVAAFQRGLVVSFEETISARDEQDAIRQMLERAASLTEAVDALRLHGPDRRPIYDWLRSA